MADIPLLHLFTVSVAARRISGTQVEYSSSSKTVAAGDEHTARTWAETEAPTLYPPACGWTDFAVHVELVPPDVVMAVAAGYLSRREVAPSPDESHDGTTNVLGP